MFYSGGLNSFIRPSRFTQGSGKSNLFGVADGTRTRDNWNHNPGLYQLSYGHH